MTATREGGLKAAQTNRLKYGEDFYSRLGKLGGVKGRGHTFAHGKVDPVEAGRKGGKISKRGPAEQTIKQVVVEEEHKWYAKFKHILSK